MTKIENYAVRLLSVTASASCLLAGCGGSPAVPSVQPTPVATSTPTPTPAPTPTGIVLPVGMKCDPTPPPMLRMQLKVHAVGETDGRTVLDSKPLVVNVDHYCDRVGFGDWKFCETRPEGDLQREACDYLAVGVSDDTGRWGPTWYYENTVCSASTRCANHAANQFLAIAKNSGTFKACAADNARVAENGTRCGTIDVE